MEKSQFNKIQKKFTDIKNMGIDMDKNEYREIVLSNSAHPENFYKINRNEYEK